MTRSMRKHLRPKEVLVLRSARDWKAIAPIGKTFRVALKKSQEKLRGIKIDCPSLFCRDTPHHLSHLPHPNAILSHTLESLFHPLHGSLSPFTSIENLALLHDVQRLQKRHRLAVQSCSTLYEHLRSRLAVLHLCLQLHHRI